MFIRIPVLLLCLCLHALPALAVVQLGPGDGQVSLDGRIEYLEDAGRKLGLADLTNPAVRYPFTQAPTQGSLNFGYSSSAYWLKIPLSATRGCRRPVAAGIRLPFPGQRRGVCPGRPRRLHALAVG